MMIEREYYGRLWSSEGWGRREPNADEQLRAETILRFLGGFVLPAASLPRPLRMLDLGCGRGWLTRLLGAYGEVLGVDPVPEAIARARALYPGIDVRPGTAADVLASAGPRSFGLVVATEAIEHIADAGKRGFLEQIYELLVPGGFAILTTPRGELRQEWERHYSHTQPVEAWITEARLEELCRSVGFEIRARDRVFVPGYRRCWAGRVVEQRRIRALLERYPHGRLATRIRHALGTYQAILLQRPVGAGR